MSKSGKTKGLQIVTAAVAAAALIGAFTIGGDKSFDDVPYSLSTPDTSVSDNSDYAKTHNSNFDSDTDFTENYTFNNSLSDTTKDTDTVMSSNKDTDTISDKSSDNDKKFTDTDKSSDTDTNTDTNTDTDSDNEQDNPSGTIFPYRGVWNLIVVNKNNPIPENYDFTLSSLDNGKQVDSRIYDDLQNMLNDMTSAGVYPVIGEAYRTAEEQEEIMQNYISEYLELGYSEEGAKAEAEKWVAKPGTSEHQLGLALDINADTDYSSNETVYGWLAQNAYKYGFILRYPEGKENITGIDYEPWHYRYVGTIAAEEIYKSGECLEEYLTE